MNISFFSFSNLIGAEGELLESALCHEIMGAATRKVHPWRSCLPSLFKSPLLVQFPSALKQEGKFSFSLEQKTKADPPAGIPQHERELRVGGSFRLTLCAEASVSRECHCYLERYYPPIIKSPLLGLLLGGTQSSAAFSVSLLTFPL